MTATTTKKFNLKKLEQWAFKVPGDTHYVTLKLGPDGGDVPYNFKNVKLVGNRIVQVLSANWLPCWISRREFNTWDKILLDTTPLPEYYIVSHKIAVMSLRYKKRMENKYG